ncbi:MAG: hypothetical protein CM1200mP26_08330 [Acidimicrobiales bacterium]|nr:MAG: hypothetical protein CM1200mP26_08330 [Acidimicrobiales bacterium]
MWVRWWWSTAGSPLTSKPRPVAPHVVVSGGVQAKWVGACRRCLGNVGGDLDLRVQEVLSAGSSVAGRHDSRSDVGTDTGEELGDAYPLSGDEADLEPVVRDAVLLALPLSPLCVEDCAGPDPDRFPGPWGVFPSQRGRPVARSCPGDPRWAALDVLYAPED